MLNHECSVFRVNLNFIMIGTRHSDIKTTDPLCWTPRMKAVPWKWGDCSNISAPTVQSPFLGLVNWLVSPQKREPDQTHEQKVEKRWEAKRGWIFFCVWVSSLSFLLYFPRYERRETLSFSCANRIDIAGCHKQDAAVALSAFRTKEA